MTVPIAYGLETKREHLRGWIAQGKTETPTQGIDHVAIFAKDLEATASFYTDVLGMRVLNVTANRDVPMSTHMNVDIGSGMALSFFDFPHVPRLRRRAPEGMGGIMHVAISTPSDRLNDLKERLSQGGVKYQEIGGSVYFKDPNGLGIELLPIS